MAHIRTGVGWASSFLISASKEAPDYAFRRKHPALRFAGWQRNSLENSYVQLMFIVFLFAVKSCKISEFEAFNQATCGLSLLGGQNGPSAVEFEIKADGIESQTGFIHHPQSLLDGLLPNAQRCNGMDIFFAGLGEVILLPSFT